MGKFDQALADCNERDRQVSEVAVLALVNRADAYLAKGDLDAALKDYNYVLGLNPEQCPRPCRARPVVREEARPGPGARRLPVRRAYALTPYDDIDAAHGAQHRAGAAGRAARPQSAGSGANTVRRIALIIGNGAYQNVHAARQPAARRQADRRRLARTSAFRP